MGARVPIGHTRRVKQKKISYYSDPKNREVDWARNQQFGLQGVQQEIIDSQIRVLSTQKAQKEISQGLKSIDQEGGKILNMLCEDGRVNKAISVTRVTYLRSTSPRHTSQCIFPPSVSTDLNL